MSVQCAPQSMSAQIEDRLHEINVQISNVIQDLKQKMHKMPNKMGIYGKAIEALDEFYEATAQIEEEYDEFIRIIHDLKKDEKRNEFYSKMYSALDATQKFVRTIQEVTDAAADAHLVRHIVTALRGATSVYTGDNLEEKSQQSIAKLFDATKDANAKDHVIDAFKFLAKTFQKAMEQIE